MSDYSGYKGDSEIQDSYRNTATLSVYYGMYALVLLAVGIFVVRGNWESAVSAGLIFLLMFVPSILKERYRLYLPFTLDLGLTVFIFLTLFLGEVGRFYDRIPLWDKFLHFQSGLLLGAAGYVLVYALNEHKKFKLDLSPGFVSIFAVTFSLAIGVVWEMLEFVGDSYLAQHIAYYFPWQANNADTMWDLIAAADGALIVSIAGYFWMHRYKRLPFTPWILRLGEKLRIPPRADGGSM